MQQHSGQHLLSAVFVELLGVQTVSFHLGQESSTIDLEAPALGAEQVRAAELRANELAAGNRPVTVTFAAPADSLDLRKAPEREGTLRIVTIEGLDRSACGGTHVRASGEIGPILIRKLSKVRDTVRVEFLCGLRAIRRARADYDALSAIAQAFSAPPDDAPLLVQSLQESAREAGKVRRRLEEEIAGYQGRELYAATPPDAAGLRRLRRRGTLDELRPLAQSFCAQAGAVFVGIVEDPPALLLATSSDSGVDAGNRLRAAVTEAGGRGGGNARLAQGSVPSREMLDVVAAKLEGTSQALRT